MPTLRRFLPILAIVTTLYSCKQSTSSSETLANPNVRPADIISLTAVVSSQEVELDIRYHGNHNFIGKPIDGYEKPRCLLTKAAVNRLVNVKKQAENKGYKLKIYDCYRPQKAVNQFVAWANNNDSKMKAEFYPNIAKSALLPGDYIASTSGHSRGSTIDLTLVKLPAQPSAPYNDGDVLKSCTLPAGQRYGDNSIDMGTGYDCFDKQSGIDAQGLSATALQNRKLLRDLMESNGFVSLYSEWWHFRLKDEPYKSTYFNFPVN